MSPSQSWTPAPVTNAVEEAESAEKLFGAQPEEKAVAEMFDAIVEEEAFSGQPPGRVATGELFGGEVAPLAAADAFTAARTRRRIGRRRWPGFSRLLTPRRHLALRLTPPRSERHHPRPRRSLRHPRTSRWSSDGVHLRAGGEQPATPAAFGPPPDAAARWRRRRRRSAAFAPPGAAAAFGARRCAAAFARHLPTPRRVRRAAGGSWCVLTRLRPPHSRAGRGRVRAPPTDAAAAFGAAPEGGPSARRRPTPRPRLTRRRPPPRRPSARRRSCPRSSRRNSPSRRPRSSRRRPRSAPARRARRSEGRRPTAAAFAPAPEEPAAASMFGAPPPATRPRRLGRRRAATASAPRRPMPLRFRRAPGTETRPGLWRTTT